MALHQNWKPNIFRVWAAAEGCLFWTKEGEKHFPDLLDSISLTYQGDLCESNLCWGRNLSQFSWCVSNHQFQHLDSSVNVKALSIVPWWVRVLVSSIFHILNAFFAANMVGSMNKEKLRAMLEAAKKNKAVQSVDRQTVLPSLIRRFLAEVRVLLLQFQRRLLQLGKKHPVLRPIKGRPMRSMPPVSPSKVCPSKVWKGPQGGIKLSVQKSLSSMTTWRSSWMKGPSMMTLCRTWPWTKVFRLMPLRSIRMIWRWR